MGPRIRDAARETVTETIQFAHDLAYEYSSGPYSAAELAHMDHPYAVRHGEPLLPPEITNVQSGELRNSFLIEGPIDSGDVIRGSVWNSSPHAVFLESGTSRMFARPIADEVQIKTGPVFRTTMERKMSEVLHG